MFARVSTYELEQGRASEALEAFEPAIESIRGLDGFVDSLAEGEGAYILTTYTAMLALRKTLADRGAVTAFWEQ